MATETAPDTVEQGPGEMFGPYRLEGTIGRGGMGEVFRAYDTGRERTVALKRLRPALAQDDEYQDRFRRESRVAARLSSPHVVPIHDFGEIDGSLFIDMRLVSGHDLGAEIAGGGRLEPGRAADVVRQVADALDAAHEDGLVHRDVKPSNILLTTHRGRDFVYLVDFGIVRSVTGDEHSRGLTSTGLAVGTLSYMAPEMFLSGTVDRRVDVYALACVLFEALTGRPPFTGEGPALMYEHLHAAPPRLSTLLPGVPASADAVLERGLAKDPEQRWASAGDLADAAVEALASGATVPTQRTAGDAADAATARATAVAGPAMPLGHPSGPQGAPPHPSGPQGAPPHPSGPQGAPPTAPGPWSGPTPGPGGPGWGPPPAGYGPPAGFGPSTPYPGPPPRRRTPTAVWVVVAVITTVLVLVGGLVVAGLALGGDPAPAAGPADPGTAAPAAGSPRPDDVSGRTIRAAFPDIAARNCQAYAPQDGEYVTSSGVRPLALYRCAYADAAPNGYVYYAQWPDQASADRYQADQVSTGPSTDGTDTWGPGRDTWGRLHTRQAQGYLYATGGYDTRPFTFDIAVTNIAERDAILRTMSLLPAAQLPVG